MTALQDTTNARMNKLEADIKELGSQGRKMQAWLQEAGTRMESTEKQVGIMSTALAKQEQNILQTRKDMSNGLDKLQLSFQGTVQTMQNDMQTTLSQQMDAVSSRIEALLEKRARTE